MFRERIVALLFVSLLPSLQAADFVRDVRPILEQHCYECHAGSQQKSGLRLDIKSEAFAGGDGYGPSIIAGEAHDSPLLELVRSTDSYERMPPEGDGLSVSEIKTLEKWIAEGAEWPDGVDLAEVEDRLDHWSFKPMAPPKMPSVQKADWPKNEIDRFVLARLENEGWDPAPPVDPIKWLRRVSIDLTGLPPTPAEASAFQTALENDPAALEHAVDRLLRSPRYGERWAQHWLDVVRYADTHGFEVNTERPHAWPYRDYVIAAFNDDVPYDRFIREQIAGDVLQQDAATGFLITASVLLPGQIGKDDASKRLARQDALDEIIVNIGQTFLGLSVACARCHDHKFDPISQRDYYAMQAFVAGVEYADRVPQTPAANARKAERARIKERLDAVAQRLAGMVPLANSGFQRSPVHPRMNVDRFPAVATKQVRFSIRSTNLYEPCIDELEVFNTKGRNVALAKHETRITASGSKTSANRHELRLINDGRYGNSKSWMSDETGKGWVVAEFAEAQEIDRVVWGRDREGKYDDRLATDYSIEVLGHDGQWQLVSDASDRAAFVADQELPAFSTDGLEPDQAQTAKDLVVEQDELEAQLARVAEDLKVFAGKFRTPDSIHLLHRGDPEQPKEEVAPAVLGSLGTVELPQDAPEVERRVALAEWIASDDHPLTARVLVNRLWQGHFGIGLAETANDFGRMGVPPTHPALLDWLALEFIRSGWSIKHMHRLIVLSATYRQSTQHNPSAFAQDAEARLMWRYPTRRIDAEVIRDSMLLANGRLDFSMGGRGYNLFNQRGGLSGFTPVESFSDEGLRRMIYAHKVRRERDAVFGAFDCPDGGQSTARRIESTTPIQALNLFNSRFTIEQANALANRVREAAGDNLDGQIRHAFELSLTRPPNDEELADCRTVVGEHGLATLCRALFNSNEFLFMP